MYIKINKTKISRSEAQINVLDFVLFFITLGEATIKTMMIIFIHIFRRNILFKSYMLYLLHRKLFTGKFSLHKIGRLETWISYQGM